jgi:hypothetical protein
MLITRDSFLSFVKSLPVIVVLALLVLANGKSTPFNNPAQTNQAPIEGDRKADVMKSAQMPANTTVVIVEIRNLQGEHWLRDLEIEVQNNSGKPIYFMEVILYFPDIPKITDTEGIERGFATSLIYGRRDLTKLKQRITHEDVPILPGEKCILRIPEPKWRGLEAHLARNNIQHSTIKRVRLRIYSLNFGDGTGFKVGAPYSVKQSSISNSLPLDQLTTLKTKTVLGTNKFLSRNLIYSRSPKLNRPVSVSTALPQLGCGPPNSNCGQYEQVMDDCPATGPCHDIL